MQRKNTFGIVVAVLVVLIIVGIGYIFFLKNTPSKNPTIAYQTELATAKEYASAPKSMNMQIAKPTGTAPQIVSFESTSTSPGSTITIKGSGFSRTSTNFITFGSTKDMHHTDGTYDNVIDRVPSKDGTTITFRLPEYTFIGELCSSANKCSAVTPSATSKLQPGSYPVTVRNQNGISNTLTFTVSVSK